MVKPVAVRVCRYSYISFWVPGIRLRHMLGILWIWFLSGFGCVEKITSTFMWYSYFSLWVPKVWLRQFLNIYKRQRQLLGA